jgi:hypothetical protein
MLKFYHEGGKTAQTSAIYMNSFSIDATTYEVGTSGSGVEAISLASSTCW